MHVPAREHRPMHHNRKAGVVRCFTSCCCCHCRCRHRRSYPDLIPTAAAIMQLPSPPPSSPLLLSQSFCGCITVVLSSGVVAITTATMGAPVSPTASPTATVRASPAISTAEHCTSRQHYTVTAFIITIPTVPVANYTVVYLATIWVLTLFTHVSAGGPVFTVAASIALTSVPAGALPDRHHRGSFCLRYARRPCKFRRFHCMAAASTPESLPLVLRQPQRQARSGPVPARGQGCPAGPGAGPTQWTPRTESPRVWGAGGRPDPPGRASD